MDLFLEVSASDLLIADSTSVYILTKYPDERVQNQFPWIKFDFPGLCGTINQTNNTILIFGSTRMASITGDC